ncbi:hypothetical protein ADUPG1_010680 [Aduncisulcus paluster]|uniref:Uncharacterized protein n=1 Tax=Aduncisulcus paluster TaxID=2918883 RepID=A0ABQ5JSD5_9EUKA|nr:hypothetical protein ADUPG1_010680 [Aduncisulcus paluster]
MKAPIISVDDIPKYSISNPLSNPKPKKTSSVNNSQHSFPGHVPHTGSVSPSTVGPSLILPSHSVTHRSRAYGQYSGGVSSPSTSSPAGSSSHTSIPYNCIIPTIAHQTRSLTPIIRE